MSLASWIAVTGSERGLERPASAVERLCSRASATGHNLLPTMSAAHTWVAQLSPDRGESKLAERTMRPHRLRFLIRSGVEDGARCLAIGPGAVAVALLLREVVGSRGEVVCLDPRAEAIDAARSAIANVARPNLHFRVATPEEIERVEAELVYGVNLFTTTTDPEGTAEVLGGATSSGGRLILEEIDLRGAGTEPPSPAVHRWLDLRAALTRSAGGDPDAVGRALSRLVRQGFDLDDVQVAQPTFVHGSGRHAPIAEFEAARADLVSNGLLAQSEAQQLLEQLRHEAISPGMVMFWPRVVLMRSTRLAAGPDGHPRPAPPRENG